MSKTSQLKALINQLVGELNDAVSFMETFEAESLGGDAEEGAQRLQDKYDALEKVEKIFMELGI